MSIQTTGLPPGVKFYDNAHDTPKAQWGLPIEQGWNMFTGSSQNTANSEDLCSIKVLSEGQEGAPKPRVGTKMYRIQITKHPTMQYLSGDQLQHLRAELYWLGGGQAKTGWKWAGQSIFIPKGFCFGTERFGLSFDLKRISGGGSPIFRLEIKNGRYNIEFNNYLGTAISKDLGPVIVDTWEDWAMYSNHKQDNSGLFRFYRNKQLVFEVKGVPVYNYEGGDQTRDPYMLNGPYKWVWASPNGQGEGAPQCNGRHVFYFAEFRFGTEAATLDTISPTGTPTTPPPTDPPPTQPAGKPVFDPVTPDFTTGKSTLDIKLFARHTATEPGTHIKSFVVVQTGGPTQSKITTHDQVGFVPTEIGVLLENLVDGTYDYSATVKDSLGGTSVDQFKVIKKSALPPPDTNIYYQSSVESTENIIVGGVAKTVKSVVITWADGTKTEIYKK